MKNLSAHQLKIMRNIISATGVVGGFIFWTFIPSTFTNTRLFHVGDGKTGTKYGALIILLLQLVAFIPDKNEEEIHTTDPEERAEIEEQRNKTVLEKQVVFAFAMAFVIWAVMGFGALFIK